MRRLAPLLLCAQLGCTAELFLYGNVPVDEYHWDEVDPNLDGEISDPHPSLVPAELRTEDFVEANGDAIHYVFAHQPGATRTIFFSHGTARNIGRYWDRVELMWGLGYNVMIYDYPGFGRSEGEPDEAGMNASAEAVLTVLPGMPGVDMNQVYLYGYSLGGVPTYHLAVSTDQTGVLPRGVMTESIFCDAQTLVEDLTFVDLPASFAADDALDNCGKIGDVPVTVRELVLHGRKDDFVRPIHARRLAENARDPFELVWAEDGKHSDIPLAMGQAYDDLLVGFMGR